MTAVSGGLVINTRTRPGRSASPTPALSTGSTRHPCCSPAASVTSQITSGSIGARLALRDTTLPQAQAGLDEFAQTLATRLDNQGLNLFTDPAGNPPATGGSPTQAGYIGFSNEVRSTRR